MIKTNELHRMVVLVVREALVARKTDGGAGFVGFEDISASLVVVLFKPNAHVRSDLSVPSQPASKRAFW